MGREKRVIYIYVGSYSDEENIMKSNMYEGREQVQVGNDLVYQKKKQESGDRLA